ncbi:hypothetical protein BDZ88DRAFT_471130 [Geranomyces variabilis]|nr:hypothetical protein BDZ88DRAFT_471130 [Geranomyces variabilis]
MDDPVFVSAVKATALPWREFAADLQKQRDELPIKEKRNAKQTRDAKRLKKWLDYAETFQKIKKDDAAERKVVLEIHRSKPEQQRKSKARSLTKTVQSKKAKTTTQPLAPSAAENRKQTSAEQTDSETHNLTAVRAMLLKISPRLEGLYLIRLGRLKDLQVPMAIANGEKNTDVVFKFGHTDNFAKRFLDHINDFGLLPGVQLTLEKAIHTDGARGSRIECRFKEWVGNRNWIMRSSGGETLKDGSTRSTNRKEVIVVPAKFVAELRKQFETLLEDFGGLPLAGAVESLEQAGERERTLHAALLKAERATCDATIAHFEAENQVLKANLECERRLAERDAEEIKRLRGDGILAEKPQRVGLFHNMITTLWRSE